jgi:hypothetical protein
MSGTVGARVGAAAATRLRAMVDGDIASLAARLAELTR